MMPSAKPRHLITRINTLAVVIGSVGLAGCETDGRLPDPHRYPLIPLPREIESHRGEFDVSAETRVELEGASSGMAPTLSRGSEAEGIVEVWLGGLRAETGFELPLGPITEGGYDNSIRIRLDLAATAPPPGSGLPGIEAESYTVRVRSGGIELEAGGLPGLYYGLQSLDQLLVRPEESGAPTAGPAWTVPAVDIADAPRFRYRGMMLDVGRHFFPVDFIKRYLDLLAAYRMNVFHWHLTEDQGWRIEIEGYPRLTDVGSCRDETILEKNFDPYIGDGIPHCGFYTQDEIREVVEHAAQRHITVIPEIELPGHSVAALAAYPELACTSGPFEVSTVWGVKRDIYCPKEETFAFLEDVLTEVMNLFPSPYVHIGGDEAPKARWEESVVAQEVMRREGLADEEELQSYFIRRIEAFLNANGRRIIGWDEILEGGLAPDATVMSWRGMTGGIEAAQDGHDVIMTPTSHLYFDYYQGSPETEPLAIGGLSTLKHVYSFEPIPDELSASKARHVLGAQGNVWTEYMKTPEYVEYMVLPRMLALSEVVWSPARSREWGGFAQRLPSHLARLGAQGFNFRVPDVGGLESDRLTLNDTVVVELQAPVAGEIQYTVDGTDPTSNSPTYDGPLSVRVDETGATVAARVFLPDGRAGGVRKARFTRTELIASVSFPRSRQSQGLEVHAWTGGFRSVEQIEGGEPLTVESDLRRPGLPALAPPEGFGLILTGYLRVPRSGVYTFFLTSDDGSRLRVGNRVAVDHDGPHTLSEAAGQVALGRGWHPLELRYFQGGGGKGLRLEMEGPGLTRRPIPAHWFAYDRSTATSPGAPR